MNTNEPTHIARVIEVIETSFCEGRGTEQDLARIVRKYWSKDGKLLAVNDPIKESLEIRYGETKP